MLIKKIVRASLVSVLLLATACSFLTDDDGIFRDRGQNYRDAKVEPLLQLPEGMESSTIEDGYSIPPITDSVFLAGDFELPRPEVLDDAVERDAVRINKLGDQQWILVDGRPGQVWPRLRGFLSLNSLDVRRADGVNGIIETAWLQPKIEGSLRERYRLRIEQGVQRGTSEVYVLQADFSAGEDDWPQHSSNAEREELMVQGLAQYLADSAAAAAVSMLAQQAIDASGKVSLDQDGDTPYIRLELSFVRAWASLERAVKKAEFELDDLDRSQGVYYVRYVSSDDESETPGFFAGLLGGDDDEVLPGSPYIIRMSQQGDELMHITIEARGDDPLDLSENIRLLKLIKKHLA